jgi:spermidine dehydrogenase
MDHLRQRKSITILFVTQNQPVLGLWYPLAHKSHRGEMARRDIAGIVLNRWGHASVNPHPGFFIGKDGKPAPPEILRAAPFGRIAFANTDLSGTPDHKTAVLEAHRAIGQLLDLVIT